MNNAGFAIAIALILALAAPAVADRYEITGGPPNLVRFESKAPIESFDGKTRQAKGSIEFDPTRLADSIKVYVEVDLTTLDTGIGLRNQHMRDNHLETDTYPHATFRGGRILEASATALALGTPVRVLVDGEFEIHGIALPMQIPLDVTAIQHDGRPAVRIQGTFPVRLADHKIARPSFLVMKLDEVQRVTIDLLAYKTGE